MRPNRPRSLRQHEVLDLSLGPVSSASAHAVELDVAFVGPTGAGRRVPAFAGDGEWRVRYASGEVGRHRFRVVEGEVTTEAREGEFEVLPAAEGDRSLRARGPIRV